MDPKSDILQRGHCVIPAQFLGPARRQYFQRYVDVAGDAPLGGIGAKPMCNHSLLFDGQPGCIFGIVRHEEEDKHSKNHCVDKSEHVTPGVCGCLPDGTPSRIKSHRQPSRPIAPFMCPTPYAMALVPVRPRKRHRTDLTYPPNAPASVALHKKIAMRVARSSGRYQKDIRNTMPGNTPASAAPRMKRNAARVG